MEEESSKSQILNSEGKRSGPPVRKAWMEFEGLMGGERGFASKWAIR
jgi:hypothetical protein